MKARWMLIPTVLSMLGATSVWADEALARRSGCLECHNVDQAVASGSGKEWVGPALHDIAAKYRGNAQARAMLVDTVKKGGKGNWTEISKGAPMPPYSPRLSDAEIQRLVDWLLKL